MQTEIEAKFLNINANKIRDLLQKSGGKLVHPERLMRRKNFDYPDHRLENIGGWIRVRDEGDQTTLSYKQLVDRTIEGTKEISVVVEDFDKTCTLLSTIGLVNKSYQETKRERWDLDGVEVTLDTWPWIPTFVEVEGPNEPAVKAAADQLGLNWSEAIHGSVENAYQDIYDTSEAEIDSWASITFIAVPEWLELKRKKL